MINAKINNEGIELEVGGTTLEILEDAQVFTPAAFTSLKKMMEENFADESLSKKDIIDILLKSLGVQTISSIVLTCEKLLEVNNTEDVLSECDAKISKHISNAISDVIDILKKSQLSKMN